MTNKWTNKQAKTSKSEREYFWLGACPRLNRLRFYFFDCQEVPEKIRFLCVSKFRNICLWYPIWMNFTPLFQIRINYISTLKTQWGTCLEILFHINSDQGFLGIKMNIFNLIKNEISIVVYSIRINFRFDVCSF